ncbi:MAG: hypothetical protein ABIK37_07235, partial [candidate division WOR-3 bacterium]
REAKASRKKKPPVIQAPPAADTQAVKQAKTRAENFAKSIRADVPRIRFDSEEQMRRIANITIKKGLPEGAHIIITAARKQIAEKVGHQGKDFTDWRTFYDAGASSDLDLVLGAQAGAGATRKSPQPADILPVGADISQLTLGPRVADTIKEIDEKFVEPSVKFTGDSGDRIENMSRAYLSEYGRYPSPDTAMLLTLYTPPWLKTIDDYRNVLRPGGNIVIPERPEYEGAQDISFGPGTGDTLRAFFKNPYQPSYRDIGKLEVEPPDVEAIEDALKFINVKPPYRPFSSYAEERGQLIRDLSLALTGRPSNEWTPELDSQLRSLVFRGALAFNLFATDEQMKDKSSKLLEFASKGALGDDANLVPVIEAMRFSADPENSDKYTEAIREVAYDGFIEYQTKINKKPEWQAEYEYAKTFGYGNMPAKDAEDVKERLEWFTHYISYIKWPFQKAKEGLQIAGRETREALIEVGEWVAEPLEDVAIRIDNELMERHPEEWKAVKKAMVEWYEATDKYVVEPVIAAVSWFARKVREGMANIGKAYTAYDEFMNRIMTTAYFSLTDDSPNSVGKSWNMAEGVRFTDEVLDDLGIDHEAYPTFANTANFVGAIGRDIFVWKGVRGVAATGGKAAYKAARAAHGPVEMGTKTQPVEILEPISAQVGKPHRVKSPSGYYTRVAEVTIDGKPVEVDAGIAEFVDRLNKGGYRTYGSHSPLKSDHPIVKTNTGKTVAHPARDVKSYIEFEKGVDTETLSEIAKKHGLETEISPEGRLIVRSPFTGARGRGKWSAFTRDALEARPPEIVEMPIGVKGLWDWILVNNSEAIAFGTNPGDEYIIKKLWGIAQVESERANSQIQLMVKSMARSKDPTQVRFALQQLAEFHDQIIDPDMPGLWKMAKMKIYRDGLNAAMPTILQMATDFIHIGNDSPMYNADDSIYLIGRSVKMGKQDWTPADARELKRLASRMYLAKNDIERLKIFHDFDELIISRLSEQPAKWTVRVGNRLVRKHGTMWDYYNHW